MCDVRDLGAYAETRAPHTGTPAVFVYERYPGGVGMSARLFETAGAGVSGAPDLGAHSGGGNGCPPRRGPAPEGGGEGKSLGLLLPALLFPVAAPPRAT